MNKIINKFHIILCVIIYAALSSCGDMDDTYRHFWDNGEKVYPAPADSLKIYGGKNRVAMSWTIFGDPNVNTAKIFWNNQTDSLILSIQSTEANEDVYVEIDNLSEGNYSFEVFTYDKNGNKSVPREGIGTVYGPNYERTLLPRFLRSALFAEDTLKILWSTQNDTTLIRSEVYYKNLSGIENKIEVLNDVDTTFIFDYDFESYPTINYRSVYVPPASIDTFYTAMKTTAVRGAPLYFSRALWVATASSFDSRAGSSYRPPENTIDGVLTTLWVNQISPQLSYPHTLIIDMGEIVQDVAGVSLTMQTKRNETPKTIEIEVSENGENWNLMGTYNVENIAAIVQDFDFPIPQNIRHFRVICKEAWGTTDNVVIAEVDAYTYNR